MKKSVVVLAAAPGGASGLDPVAPGGAAPLPGSIPGADLTSSVTYAEGFDLTRSLTIESDEQWISESGVAAIGSSSGIDVALVNYGQIVSTGGADGWVKSRSRERKKASVAACVSPRSSRTRPR